MNFVGAKAETARAFPEMSDANQRLLGCSELGDHITSPSMIKSGSVLQH